MSRAQARLAFITAVFIYGTIGPLIRLIDAPSDFIALIRGALGCLTIAAALALKGEKLDVEGIRRNRGWLVATGLCLGLNWVALFAAYTHASVAIASVCNYTAPLIVVLVAPLIFKERISPFKFGCVVVAMLGIALISGVFSGDAGNFDAIGIGLGMLAALFFVGIVICNRFVSEVESLSRVMIQLGSAAAVALVYVLVVHRGLPMPADVRSWALCLFLGVFYTGFAYILWFGAQNHLPLQEVALLGYIEPVVSVILSAVVLGEPLGIAGICGAALVLGAAAASELVA